MSGTSTRVHDEWQGSAGASPPLFGVPAEKPFHKVSCDARDTARGVPALRAYRLKFVAKGERCFSLVMLLITSTDITVWIVSAMLALGIGSAKYAKWRQRNQLVRELAAMDRERREKVLSRMNPAQAMEARQELMRRFNIF